MITTPANVANSPLDVWVAQRIGIGPDMLTREAVSDYQLKAVRQTIHWARTRSKFHASRLAAFPTEWPRTLEEFELSPLTSPDDIVEHGHEFLCVPQSEISRVVTLETSGTSGTRKRIFFTKSDQNLALDFFAHGVTAMAEPGDRMFVALPGEREGSVGFQLARGIARAGVHPIPNGLISDPTAALARMDMEKATLLIGLPVQVLALTLEPSDIGRRVFRRLHTIVLCSDHVPMSLANRIRHATGSEIFEHYGSTEMGLGGGLDCRAHAGYHLREADLYFEIVSPQTGEPVPYGQSGEVVFTTLGRTGMPLIRYRTGDLARIISDPCSCGSPLRRLSRIDDRVDSAVNLGPAGGITISALDEVLFAIPEVYDFTANFIPGVPNRLGLHIYAPGASQEVCDASERALSRLPVIALSIAAGELRLDIMHEREPFAITGAKRKIGVQSGL